MTFTFTDKHGGETMVSIEGDAVRISGECGHVTLSHHTLAAIFEESNGHRLAPVAEDVRSWITETTKAVE